MVESMTLKVTPQAIPVERLDCLGVLRNGNKPLKERLEYFLLLQDAGYIASLVMVSVVIARPASPCNLHHILMSNIPIYAREYIHRTHSCHVEPSSSMEWSPPVTSCLLNVTSNSSFL